MNKLTQHLSHPLPFVKRRWGTVLFATLWVFLLAIILKPFDFGHNGAKLWIAISYTSIVPISCVFVIFGFPRLFKVYFAPNKFTNGKFYLACLSILVIATTLCCILAYYIAMIEKMDIIYSTIERIAIWFVYVSFIALFPIIIVYASLRSIRQRMKLQDIENILASKFPESDKSENKIVLGKNAKVPLELPLNKLLYIEALGNNITIHYTKDGSIKEKRFRETLIQLVDDLKDYPQVVRCHRSFVVNIDNVTFAEDPQSDRLIVSANGANIPVSRLYTKEVREKLTQFL